MIQELLDPRHSKNLESLVTVLEGYDVSQVRGRVHHPHTNLTHAYRALKQPEQSRRWTVRFLGEASHLGGL